MLLRDYKQRQCHAHLELPRNQMKTLKYKISEIRKRRIGLGKRKTVKFTFMIKNIERRKLKRGFGF